MSRLLLRDHIDDILVAVADDMRELQSVVEQTEKGQGRGPKGRLDQAGRSHAGQRLDVGFRLDQVIAEIRALRASIVRLWEESAPEPSERNLSDLVRFNEAIDQLLIESASTYTRTVDVYREQSLAILGHDLKNPLAAILMSGDLLSRAEDLDAGHAQAVRRIRSSAQRMSRLVSDLLDLTRARLGSGLPVTPGPVDLGEVCRRVLDELRAVHPDRTLRFEPSGDLRGEWDGERLAQLVSNLVANALEHGGAAAPVVLSAEPRGAQITLAVHNEGPAIPPEDVERIFEPMVRSESAEQARSPGGLGLGLFIVREIVTAHGGEVSVTSSAEQGTTFTVRLPRRPPPSAGSPRAA